MGRNHPFPFPRFPLRRSRAVSSVCPLCPLCYKLPDPFTRLHSCKRQEKLDMIRHRKCSSALLSFLLVASLLAGSAIAQNANTSSPKLNDHQQQLREIYKELIEINTTDSPAGDNTKAAEAMAARLKAAGFPAEDVRVLVHPGNARKGNLVARFRGAAPSTRKPLLLLAHIDVVEARKEDWSDGLDPFKFTERDGYYYGRGTRDDKAMAAIFVANLIRYKKGRFPPRPRHHPRAHRRRRGRRLQRRRVAAEGSHVHGDAELASTRAAGVMKKGQPIINGVQASEKVSRASRSK